MIVELFVLLSGVVSALAAFLPEVPLPVVFLPVVFLQKTGHRPGCVSTRSASTRSVSTRSVFSESRPLPWLHFYHYDSLFVSILSWSLFYYASEA